VQAFYAALSTGNGEEAVKLVIPKKRSFGPLSATAISKFYGRLPEPLTLVDVVATRSGEYRVRYRYVAEGPRRCDGESIVPSQRVQSDRIDQGRERLLKMFARDDAAGALPGRSDGQARNCALLALQTGV